VGRFVDFHGTRAWPSDVNTKNYKNEMWEICVCETKCRFGRLPDSHKTPAFSHTPPPTALDCRILKKVILSSAFTVHGGFSATENSRRFHRARRILVGHGHGGQENRACFSRDRMFDFSFENLSEKVSFSNAVSNNTGKNDFAFQEGSATAAKRIERACLEIEYLN
jgi:hypothetical protein